MKKLVLLVCLAFCASSFAQSPLINNLNGKAPKSIDEFFQGKSAKKNSPLMKNLQGEPPELIGPFPCKLFRNTQKMTTP